MAFDINKPKILDLLAENNGYQAALLTTFNFEIDFFERAVFSRLVKAGIRKVSVFVDAGELAKTLKDTSSLSLGQKYAVNPVFMQGSFHPKVILLLGERKARVIIGSANLKLSSYYVNNEAFNYIDYDSDHPEQRDIICNAISFFLKLYGDKRFSFQADDSVLDWLRAPVYYRKTAPNGRTWLLHNMEQDILGQVHSLIPESIKTVYVIVPYYDKDAEALKALRKAFPDAGIHLYLQQGKNTFPERYKDGQVADVISVFDMVKEPDKNCRFYHGKVFIFLSEAAAYFLYGSSNCTQSALTHTMENGNCECNYLEAGSISDAGKFLNNLSIIEGADIESQQMVFDSENKAAFTFLYGISDSVLSLHIKCNSPFSSLAVQHDGLELEWKQKQGHLVVIMDPVQESCIIELTMITDSISEKVLCWYNNTQSLAMYRIQDVFNSDISDREDYANGEKFQEDYEKYLKAEATCLEDLQDSQDAQIRISAFQSGYLEDSNDEAEISEDDDFIVNVDISDDDCAAYQRYRAVEHIRGRISSRYIGGLSLTSFVNGSGRHQISDIFKEELENGRVRKATTEEKRFERFIRRKVRGLQEEKFVTNISSEHYQGIIMVVFDIIRKYTQEEKIADMFPASYVITARTDLLISLLNKYGFGNVSEELRKVVLHTVLDNHKINMEEVEDKKQDEYERQNRNLLLELESLCHIRSCYEKDLLLLTDEAFTVEEQMTFATAIDYIERLYGYKNLEKIKEMIHKQYGPDSGIDIQSSKAEIFLYSEKPMEHYRPNSALVSELFKYSMNIEPLSRIIIKIFNKDVKSETAISRIEHDISPAYHKYITRLIRANGKREVRKAEYI